MGEWLWTTPIWLLALLLFLAAVASAVAGSKLGRWLDQRPNAGARLSEAQEGYVVSSIFALLGLLVAFTFGLTMERYELRRQLVIQDANAIEALYLKAQLLDDPHRSRFSSLLVRYAENHLELAQLRHDDANTARLLTEDNAMLRDLWTATVPAFQSIKTIDFSTSFVDSVTEVVKLDSERRANRQAPIPGTVLVALIFFTLIAAAVLGGVLKGHKGHQLSLALLALNILALTVITDFNRPTEGTIRESQLPMQRMLARLKTNPPAVYQGSAQPPASR